MAHLHDHDHHAHGHHYGHGHNAHENHGRAFVVAIALNSIFAAIELAYGFVANSTALMADAGHNFSDVLGLALAWGAAILSRRAPSGRYTYGLRSTSILAALANSMFLMLASGAIALEAAHRFFAPPVVAAGTVMLVAGIGIAINGASALLFVRGGKGDVNIRGAYMHMAADAAMSFAVVVSGALMWATGWYWLDPLVGLAVVAAIVAGTWGLLKESLGLVLSAIPLSIDAKAVEDYLRNCPGVADMHDLHIWGMSTTESALTVHLVMPGNYPGDAFMDEITRTLRERFGVHHSTLQVEQGTTEHVCALHLPPAAAGG